MENKGQDVLWKVGRYSVELGRTSARFGIKIGY